MGRERFLRLAKEFDDNHVSLNYDDIKDEVIKITTEKNITIKKCFEKSKIFYITSEINLNKIKNITFHEDNPFKYFYMNSDKQLKIFFEVLHYTNIILKDNGFYSLRDAKSRNSLVLKYEAVIEDLQEYTFYNGMGRIRDLEERKNILTRKPTLTKRKVFENLLFNVWVFYKYCNGKKDIKTTQKIADITNQLIKDYFDEDITFSRKTDMKKFIQYNYYLDNEKKIKIELFHS